MKIIEEYIVLSEKGMFFKVILLENGLYLCVDRPGIYKRIKKSNFEKCRSRIKDMLL